MEELFHLLGSSLRDDVLFLNIGPEAELIQVFAVVGAHQLEELDSFCDCKLFLFADIQFLTLF
jgi:hypothetical protein